MKKLTHRGVFPRGVPVAVGRSGRKHSHGDGGPYNSGLFPLHLERIFYYSIDRVVLFTS